MITQKKNKKYCCGCTSCMNICPKQAIVMSPDEEGFLYPTIDDSFCVECGLCQSVCPIQNESVSGITSLAYALKHKDNNVRMKSSSGGAYTAISDYVLSKTDSVVYGVRYDDTFLVCHAAANTSTERDKFRGSKYTQSNLEGVFKQIKYDLEEGKTVLFTGTPCQVAGLKRYLEKIMVNYGRLILNDLICHGTPSPKVWCDYIKFIERKYKSKLCGYTFRAKEKGWRGYNVRADFEGRVSKLNTDAIKTYVNLFGSNLTLRPSCYECKFKSLHRTSDITIADFWGIERSLPEFEDKENGISKGISLVLINTPKGEEVFERIKGNVVYQQSNIEDCLQVNLKQPTKIPARRDEFWKDYTDKGFEFIAKKYAGYSLMIRSKLKVVNIMKKLGLLSAVRKLLGRE